MWRPDTGYGLSYRTLDSWSREAGWWAAAGDKDNPATSLDTAAETADVVYEQTYCGRGTWRTRSGTPTRVVRGGCRARFASNEVRLLLASFAQLLLERLRVIKARPRHRRYDPGPTAPSSQVTVSVRRVYVQFATSFARQVARRADPRLGGFKLRNAGPGGGRRARRAEPHLPKTPKSLGPQRGKDKSLKWYSARPAGVFEIALKGRGDKTRVMVR